MKKLSSLENNLITPTVVFVHSVNFFSPSTLESSRRRIMRKELLESSCGAWQEHKNTERIFPLPPFVQTPRVPIRFSRHRYRPVFYSDRLQLFLSPTVSLITRDSVGKQIRMQRVKEDRVRAITQSRSRWLPRLGHEWLLARFYDAIRGAESCRRGLINAASIFS